MKRGELEIKSSNITNGGVTRTGSEMQYWCDKNNIDLKVYSYDERMYNRRNAHQLNFISFTKDNLADVVKELNTYDAVLFNSYPSNKFEKEAIKCFYNDFVKKIKTIKVGFMHELNKANIDKIPYLLGIMNEMDLIYNFSELTWFSQTICKILPSKILGERTKKFTMWQNFDNFDKLRKETLNNIKEKKLLYMGRWTTMKDPRRVLELAPGLKENGISAELMGIERSVGAKFDIFEHPNCIDRTGKEEKYISENACVPVYGTYVRDEGIQKLTTTMFACSFYRMPKAPNDYGDRMEFTQIEIIGSGAIPVFDKHWSENNKTRDGRRYCDIPYSAIYSDKEDLNDTINKIVEVANNPELQKKYIETSYKLVKQEFDANIVLPEMFNYILTIGKDENKFKSDKQLIKNLIKEEYYNEFMELHEEYCDEIPVYGIRELYENDIFAILDGKKEKEIKVFKKRRLKKEK